MDHELWLEAKASLDSNDPVQIVCSSQTQLAYASDHIPEYIVYRYTDASWLDDKQEAGIVWVLHDYEHKLLIQVQLSVLEAEALALEAIVQLNRLNYKKVIFFEDSQSYTTH